VIAFEVAAISAVALAGKHVAYVVDHVEGPATERDRVPFGPRPDGELRCAPVRRGSELRGFEGRQPELACVVAVRVAHGNAQDGALRGPLRARLAFRSRFGPPEPFDELRVAPDIRLGDARAAHPDAEPSLVATTRDVGAAAELDLAKARGEQNLRTRGAERWIAPARLHERRQPARLDEDVAVHQGDKVHAGEIAQREVAPACESQIALAPDDLHVRQLVARRLNDTVQRTIVD
jgi:hypothetical protein